MLAVGLHGQLLEVGGFRLRNAGDAPLRIEGASRSYGCAGVNLPGGNWPRQDRRLAGRLRHRRATGPGSRHDCRPHRRSARPGVRPSNPCARVEPLLAFSERTVDLKVAFGETGSADAELAGRLATEARLEVESIRSAGTRRRRPPRTERGGQRGGVLCGDPGVAIGERAEAFQGQHDGLEQRGQRSVVVDAGLPGGDAHLRDQCGHVRRGRGGDAARGWQSGLGSCCRRRLRLRRQLARQQLTHGVAPSAHGSQCATGAKLLSMSRSQL